jgi:hypothetical protein
MSIRLIARDLYRLEQEVDTLEKAIATASPDRIEALKEKLRKARAERNRMRQALDGQKGTPPNRRLW